MFTATRNHLHLVLDRVRTTEALMNEPRESRLIDLQRLKILGN